MYILGSGFRVLGVYFIKEHWSIASVLIPAAGLFGPASFEFWAYKP